MLLTKYTVHVLFFFFRVFVGTVSEYLVKHVDCPVVTIKRKADEAPHDPIDD